MTTPSKAIYLFVMDGFADWEPAHALAELRRHGGYRVEAVGLTAAAVVSMGGLTILPSKTVSDVDLADVALFMLPGGDSWERESLDPALLSLLQQLDARAIPIGAICGATLAIAKAGLVRGRQHTSNGLEYLRKHAPAYADDQHYVNALAVRDHALITASGLGAVEFARELMEELTVMTPEQRSLWATVFRTGKVPVRA
jgi:putative intracellular protease/amidase